MRGRQHGFSSPYQELLIVVVVVVGQYKGLSLVELAF